MEVYNGPYLAIKYEQVNSRLISTWESSPPDDLAYRKELKEHLHIAENIKPSQIIWLLENLTFKVDEVTKKWVDDSISEPIFRAGFVGKNQDGCDQVAFVVGKDVLAYIETMGIFDKSSSRGFNPTCFATEANALNWLNGEFNTKDSNSENHNLEIDFKGTDDKGKIVFEFREQASKFDSTVTIFKTLLEQNNFMKNNVEKYSSLTPREKETLKFLVKGYTNKETSEHMYISKNTIRTHRNRIWKKLDIQYFKDCLKYECFFN